MPRKPLLDKPTLGAHGNTIGRPRKGPPDDAAERIRIAAAGGANMKGIAAACNTSADTLYRWLDEQPELQAAFDTGREDERRTLHNVLYRAATEGGGKDSLIAAMFLLKSKHGYREGDQSEQTGNRVNITFAIPAAQPMADFIEVSNADGTEVQRLSTKGSLTTRRA